jgi:hypothetical protein
MHDELHTINLCKTLEHIYFHVKQIYQVKGSTKHLLNIREGAMQRVETTNRDEKTYID